MVGLIILSVVSIIGLILAALFIWLEIDRPSHDGIGGCLALFIVIALLVLWAIAGLIVLF